MSYLATMTTLLSENKNPQHQEHIISFTAMCKEMIEELVPQIVERTLLNTYFELWVKIRMILDNKEVSFSQITDFIIQEIENELKSRLK